jgi:polysaccharide export outer membrane protein
MKMSYRLNRLSTFLRERAILLGLAIGSMIALSGCNTTATVHEVAADTPAKKVETLKLLEGDVIKIDFPGAPSLNTNQTVRRDGKITLSLAGEVDASGLTPEELEVRLIEVLGSQLNSKEVTVTVLSSSFPVFVAGAVRSPGKIQATRAISALEAIMEAGGFDPTTANLKKVVVTRLENGEYRHYNLDLQSVLEGEKSDPFYLKPSDIVTVPAKVVYF